MEKIKVPIIQNAKEKIIEEVAYNYIDFPINKDLPRIYKRGKNGGTFYNIPCTFDIESTTLEKYREDGTRYGEGFMYHWQFCLDNKVCFGRTWEEFNTLIERITNELDTINSTLVCYVHNLSYEFQFIKDFFRWESIFAKEKHKVMKCKTKNGIEFRCSYFLSNMSLIKFCENSSRCVHYKMVDNYDYKKIRTPFDELTMEEKAYCYNDVRGLSECIETMLLEDSITTIPLTNTGFVRRDYRTAMAKNKKNHYKFLETKLDAELYQVMRFMFRGGNTHANRLYANTILEDIYSVDLQSSYPAVMMMDYFPIGKFTKITIDTQSKLDKYTSKYCVILDIEFFDIIEKENNYVPYIDIAHCFEKLEVINDNGRVKSAKYIHTYITEIDLQIIRETYKSKDSNNLNFIIKRAWISPRGKLSKEFRNTLMKWYKAKTELKDSGHDYEYAKSKNRVNSSFGMLVQAIVTEEVEYINNEWIVKEIPIETALEDYYNSWSHFLSYQHGVYVTAHARRRLQEGINLVGIDDVYQDTDSVKFRNKKHLKQFEELNKKIIQECENNDIPAYVDDRGKRWHLGIWDYEGKYDKFKTLGSKKYCVEKDDKLTITVAGMNKKLGSSAVGSIENFTLGSTWENVGRTTSWYNDSNIHQITVNGDTFTTASNIGILDTTYTLGVTTQYWDLIKLNPEYLYDW